MPLVVTELRRRCEEPGCDDYATKRVNLSFFADYMAKSVCNKHVEWAEKELHTYVPTDR